MVVYQLKDTDVTVMEVLDDGYSVAVAEENHPSPEVFSKGDMLLLKGSLVKASFSQSYADAEYVANWWRGYRGTFK